MLLVRDIATINSSYADTVAVAVCVSLGGTGIVAMVVYAILKNRLRRRLLDAQDTHPRPFEIVVPAGTRNASTITHDLTPASVLDILPRTCSRNGGGESEARGNEIPLRIEPVRRGSTPTTATPTQSQPSSSRDARMRPDMSLSPNHAGPGSYRVPPGSLHTRIPSDPGVQSGQSPSFLALQPQRAAGVSTSRSAKRALRLSRSASELSALFSVPMPESGPHASSGYTHRPDGREHQAGTFVRPTNHLRHWHSATRIVRVEHGRSDTEGDPGRTVISQHQDADVHELPPPYHKLVRSGVEV